MDNIHELIRKTRRANSIANEKIILDNECALIRTAFKNESFNCFRRVNVEKLIYLSVLDYPTYFAQIEVLKLCASNSFTDKRIGYLALSLLLNEKSETLMLVTQTLKNDLHGPNSYITSSALGAITFIASEEITRDIVPIIERLMLSEHAIVKKKAIMCAAKMMRKVPDSIEAINFHKMKLFSEKNNSVFLTLCHLLQELRNYENYETQLYQAKQQLSYFEKFFKKLVTADFNPDYSVNGVNDPFLQVKIIQLLKSFRPGRNGSKEEFSTVIQIASSAENSSNSNGARLFECVKTMLSHVSESCFKAMAIDILARFLNSKDNNFKFVSLNTLSDSIREKEMILQHQFTIMDCLWDKDSSISNRALDLLHNLTCEKNYKITIKEFLKFMSKKNLDSESSKSLLIKIFNTLEKHEKDSKRYIDLLSAAISKTSKTDEFVNRKFSNFIKRGDAKTQKYFVDKMAETIFEHISEPILNLAFWGMGEYFDLAETQNKKKIIKAMDLIGADPLLVLSEKSIYFYANTLFKILLANNKKYNEKVEGLLNALLVTSDLTLKQRLISYKLALKAI